MVFVADLISTKSVFFQFYKESYYYPKRFKLYSFNLRRLQAQGLGFCSVVLHTTTTLLREAYMGSSLNWGPF